MSESSTDHTPEYEVVNGVSSKDQPSVAWGWHDISHRGILYGGLIVIVALLAMLIGNHHGKIEDFYLVGFALLVALVLFFYFHPYKGKQVTTVSAKNQPVGHVEPDWAAEQHDLTGPYAELTTSQYRVLNVDKIGVDGKKYETQQLHS